jgi:hypothetical protein
MTDEWMTNGQCSHFDTGPVLTGFKKIYILELSGKSCPVGPELHPPFDASLSPPAGCGPQSHEILLNKGMK